jgi:hypothetical protein
MTGIPVVERIGVGEGTRSRLEYAPNHREAAPSPLVLHAGMSIEVVPDIIPTLLQSYFVVAAEQPFQPVIYGEPAFRVPLPQAAGCYLRIGAMTVMPDPLNPVRPGLMMVVDLTASQLPMLQRSPPTVCRVGMIGNLFMPPTYDNRGPIHNFGLPRAMRIYAVPWMKPFSPQNLPPHPRSWRLVFENTDLRGRWGWTFCDFAPTRTSHLIFLFTHLPKLPPNFDQTTADEAAQVGVPWQFRGLCIERLAVHAYESDTGEDEAAPYVPVTSWNSAYEPQPVPFVAKY